MSTAHLTGTPVTVWIASGSQWLRQRCQWCDAVLVDCDPSSEGLRMVTLGDDETTGQWGQRPYWPPDTWVRIEDEGASVVKDEGRLFPEDSCIVRDFSTRQVKRNIVK